MKTFIFLFCFTLSLWGKPLKVEVASPTAILMNAETGAILYEKNIHQRHYPASITKIATAAYVLEKKGDQLGEITEASAHALSTVLAHLRQAADSKHPSYRLEHDGTMMGIRRGEKLSLKTLLYGLMLSSGNDAGNVLAEAVSGSIDRFMQELNEFLQKNGFKETQFTNPHGLHHPEHWTTAYDMARMTILAMKHPTFREIVKAPRYDGHSKPIVQHNALVKPGKYFYPKAIGVKTGYVAKAGRTYVGAAAHEGRELIVVLLNCAESEHRFKDAIKLFEAAFREKLVSRILFAKESDHFTRNLKGAKSPLQAVLKDDLILSYFPAEEPSFRAEIHWNKLQLPITVNQVVGELKIVSEDGQVLKQHPLLAVYEVKKKWWVYVVNFCSDYKNLFIGGFLSSQVILILLYFLKKDKKVDK